MSLLSRLRSHDGMGRETGNALQDLFNTLRDTTNHAAGQFSLENYHPAQALTDDANESLFELGKNLRASLESLGNKTISYSVEDDDKSKGAKGFVDLDTSSNATGLLAATYAAGMSFSVENFRNYVATADQEPSAPRARPNEDLVVINNNRHGDVVTKSRYQDVSVESYDESAVRTTSVFSQIYNLDKGGQEYAIEMLFPSVVVGPNEAGYGVSIPLIQVHNNPKHRLESKLTDFKFRHIVHAYVNDSILRDDATRIVPIVREVHNEWFVDAALVPPTADNLDDEVVQTAPLRIDTDINLLQVSQTQASLDTGIRDITDTIDPGIHLKKVYIKVGTEVVGINVRHLDSSNFWSAPQGPDRAMRLIFDSKVVQLRGKVLKVDGTPSTELAAIEDNGLAIRLGFNMTGTIDLALGDLVVTGDRVNVTSVMRDGEAVDVTDATIKPVVDLLKTAKVVGYDLHGFVSNSNRRYLGQLINTRYYTQLYPTKRRSPISALRSQIADTATSEATDIASLLTACSIRKTNSGIDTLLETDAILNAHVNNDEPIEEAVRVLGIAHHIVGSFYERNVIDVEAELMTLNSQDKTRDLQSVLVNRIREVVLRAHTETAYSAAADVILGNAGAKPLIMILTDPIIENYLMLHGDMRTFGNNFDVEIRSSLNIRLRGKIFVTFGIRSAITSGQANPMHFGSSGHKPELVINLPIHFNGGNHQQLTVHPNYEHNVNLPILMRFDVINIPESIIKRTPLLVYREEEAGTPGEDDNG